MAHTQSTLNAPPHPAVTRAALLAASGHLPSHAFWLGRVLYTGKVIGSSSGGRGAADLNGTHPVHWQCNAASRRHPCSVACGMKPSPFTCILVGSGAILGYSGRVE